MAALDHRLAGLAPVLSGVCLAFGHPPAGRKPNASSLDQTAPMPHIKSRKHARPRPSVAPSLAAATLLTSLAAAPGVAVAQVAPDAVALAPATDLDRIDVRGYRVKRYSADQLSSPKFSQPLVDTTRTIDIIGSDLFNEQGATTLTEALRNSAGVGTFYVGENGNTNTGDAVYMRGFDSAASIFVDGVRDLGSVSRDVFNIEQIEVTKGPAGTDYGRSAPTGAINLVSKQPFQRDRVTGTATWGSADQRRVTADWNQVLGESSSSALRLNLMAQDSGVPGRADIEHKRWGVAPSLALGMDGATRVYLDLLHVRQDNLPDGGVPTIGLPGYTSPDPARPEIGAAPRVDPSNFYGTDSDHDDVTVDMATAIVEHDFSDDLRLQNTTRWGRNDQQYLLTSFRGSATNIATPEIGDPSTWTITRDLPTFKDQQNTILTNQTNLVARFDTAGAQHALSAGVEFTREQLQTHGVAALDGSAWPAASLYHPDPDVVGLQWGRNGARGRGRTDTAAAYAFDTVSFGPRWQLNGGVRIDRYRTKFDSLVACGSRGAPVCGALPAGSIVPGVDADIADTLFSWKLGVLYKPSGHGSLYANYATSQQPPGGGSLELSARPNSADNPAFDPQQARTAEVGAKWNLLGDRLLLTAALYDTQVRNEVAQDPVDQQYYQTGRKRVRGIELGVVGQITDHWSLSAGFTTLDANVTAGPDVAHDGSRDLAYTPDRAFTAWTTYEFGSGLTLGGGARYSGEMKRGTDGAVGTPDYIDGYWVFDAVAGYAFGEHAELRLNVYNLFDEDYVAAINKSGYRYTPGQPRSAMLTLNFRF